MSVRSYMLEKEKNAFFHEVSLAEKTGRSSSIKKRCAYWADSRRVSPGDAFVALPGKNSDGHRFIKDAAARGAALVFMDREKHVFLPDREFEECVFFLLENPERALELLAEHRRNLLPAHTTVAITGSVGKTSTKHVVTDMLTPYSAVSCTRESYNTSVGIDLALASVAENTENLVLEFGANSFGEIAFLAKKYKPELAVITDIAEAHTENFKNIEGVLRAKTEILDSPKMRSVFFNADNSLCSSFFSSFPRRNDISCIPVGEKADPEKGIQIKSSRIVLEEKAPLRVSMEGRVCLFGSEYMFRAPFYCDHHVYTCAYALGIARYMGINLPEDPYALFSEVGLPEGRGNILQSRENITLFDETYNANPKSMASALKNFFNLPFSQRRYLVLGGMRELGSLSEREHASLIKNLSQCEGVFLVGEEWDTPSVMQQIEASSIPIRVENEFSLEKIVDFLSQKGLCGGDLLFLKGSRFYRLERILEAFAR